MISKQVKIGSNKELTSAPRNEEANTQRHSFIAGLHWIVQKWRVRSGTKSKTRRRRSTKKKNLLIVQFVNCEYILSLDGFSDSIC
jgi:hypothetical protein